MMDSLEQSFKLQEVPVTGAKKKIIQSCATGVTFRNHDDESQIPVDSKEQAID